MSLKYKILSSLSNIKILENRINQHLQDGWQLHGSIFVDDHIFFQAVTKNEMTEKEKLKFLSTRILEIVEKHKDIKNWLDSGE